MCMSFCSFSLTCAAVVVSRSGGERGGCDRVLRASSGPHQMAKLLVSNVVPPGRSGCPVGSGQLVMCFMRCIRGVAPAHPWPTVPTVSGYLVLPSGSRCSWQEDRLDLSWSGDAAGSIRGRPSGSGSFKAIYYILCFRGRTLVVFNNFSGIGAFPENNPVNRA